MQEKKCFKCCETKPLSEYYKHGDMGDGHLNKCKECTKSDVRRHREENDSVRDYDRARYHNNPKRKQLNRDNAIRWNKRNPDGYKAHYLVSNAVRDGRLMKEPCEVCGSIKVHAHHEDYSKPLDVRWLCVRHHAFLHAGKLEI